MTIQDEDADLLMGSLHGENFHICSIAPRTLLTTISDWECDNCQAKLVRRFSGSGWYEDDALCAECGESGSGYRPFKRGWRKENIAQAKEWLTVAVSADEFSATTMRLINAEMGWDDPNEHEFRTFKDDDVCDMCEHPLADHPMGAIDTSSSKRPDSDG